MYISIDFNSDEALYLQLRNQIVYAIVKAELREGENLPSVRDMAETVGINMHTVNRHMRCSDKKDICSLTGVTVQLWRLMWMKLKRAWNWRRQWI